MKSFSQLQASSHVAQLLWKSTQESGTKEQDHRNSRELPPEEFPNHHTHEKVSLSTTV